jgi:hypothetical protein
MMINQATPNTTGFAGGGAGYQWSVKIKDGKYVLSDSYNEADFGTGDKRDEGEKEASGENEAEDAVIADTSDEDAEDTPDSSDVADSSSSDSPDASDPGSSDVADSSPASSSPGSDSSGSSGSPGSSDVAAAPGTPGSSDSSDTDPSASPEDPGTDVGVEKLEKPEVALVIQNPIDFKEERIPRDIGDKGPTKRQLEEFKIPEDTRVKMTLDLGEGKKDEDYEVIITDDTGKKTVDGTQMRNFRHMFRVPSETNYSAQVNDKNTNAPVLIVQLPVVEVEFDSRTLDGQRGNPGGESPSNYSASTSDSGSGQSYNHSSFGKSEYVDLSDLYTDPSSSFSSSENQTSDSSSSYGYSDQGSENYGDQGSDYGDSGYSDNPDSDQYADASTGNSSGQAGNQPGSGQYGNSGNSDSSYGQQGQASDGGSDYSDSSSSSSSSGPNQYGQGGDSGSYNGSGRGGSSNQSSGSGNYQDGPGNNSGQSGSSGYQDDSSSYQDQGDYADSGSQGAQGSSSGSTHGRSGQGGNNTDNLDGEMVARAETGVGYEENEDEYVDNFIMGLSMQAVSKNIYQSFDFIDETNPVSTSIPAGTEVTFSMSFSSDVDPESVIIELDDGTKPVKGDLKTWGEAFAYVFEKPSKAHFRIRGKTSKQSFSYTLDIPVR